MAFEGITIHQFVSSFSLFLSLLYEIIFFRTKSKSQFLSLSLLFFSILATLICTLSFIIIEITGNNYNGQTFFLLPRLPVFSWFVLSILTPNKTDITGFSWSSFYTTFPILSIALKSASVYYTIGSWRWSLKSHNKKVNSYPFLEQCFFWAILILLFCILIPFFLSINILVDSFWLVLSYAFCLLIVSVYSASTTHLLSTFTNKQIEKISIYDQKESTLTLSPSGLDLRAEQLLLLTNRISSFFIPRLFFLSLFMILEAMIVFCMAFSYVPLGLQFTTLFQTFICDFLHSSYIIISSISAFVLVNVLCSS